MKLIVLLSFGLAANALFGGGLFPTVRAQDPVRPTTIHFFGGRMVALRGNWC